MEITKIITTKDIKRNICGATLVIVNKGVTLKVVHASTGPKDKGLKVEVAGLGEVPLKACEYRIVPDAKRRKQRYHTIQGLMATALHTAGDTNEHCEGPELVALEEALDHLERAEELFQSLAGLRGV